MGGQSISLSLESIDRREQFVLNLSRGRIESVDESDGTIRIFEAEFRPSEVLFQLEPESYRVYLAEFELEVEGAQPEVQRSGAPEKADS